jgi:RNA recognition motif-containing protein
LSIRDPAFPFEKFQAALDTSLQIPADRERNYQMKLYVGNLSFNTSAQELTELFGTVGTVQSANVIEDRETGRSRGFGFVEMSSQEEGQNAISQLNGKEIDGRELKVNEAKPQTNRNGGGGGGGRGGYGGGSGGGGSRGGYGGGGGGGYRGQKW